MIDPPSPARRAGRRAPTVERWVDVRRRFDEQVHSDPARVVEDGRTQLGDPTLDVASQSEVWSAIGRALYELGDMRRAPTAMRRALDVDADGDPARLATVRMSAAVVLAEDGDVPTALEQLDLAGAALPNGGGGRVRSQRAYILHHVGRLDEALAAANDAAQWLRRERDQLGLLRLSVIRALVNLQRAQLPAAERELIRAGRAADRLGQRIIAAGVRANLGVVRARRGAIAEALELFAEAEVGYEAAGRPRRMMAILEMDRAEALLRAGSFRPAVAAAEVALAHAASSANAVCVGDAQLLLARVHLAAGDERGARRAATDAARTFTTTGRGAMAVQARTVSLHASLRSVDGRAEARRLLERSRRLVVRVERHGWYDIGDEMRAARLRAALRVGLLEDIDDDVAALTARAVRGSAVSVARGRYAAAVRAAREGDRPAAVRAAIQGLRVVDARRADDADVLVRSGLSDVGDDLASLGLRLAVAGRRPGDVLMWGERTRVRRAGGPTPPLAALRAALGPHSLASFVIDDDRVWAAVLTGRRSDLIDVAAAADVDHALQQLRSWQLRCVQGTPPADSSGGRRLLERIDALLIAPLRSALGATGRVVVVPSGSLVAVPWGALPSLTSRTVSVATSSVQWLATEEGRAAIGDGIELIIGPDLAGTGPERTAVRRLDPRARVVSGRRANAAAVARALHQRDVVHIAAHGRFRADQPLLSTLRLRDGDDVVEQPMQTVIGSSTAARLVVLSSCEAGAHADEPGSGGVGLAGLLLDSGARSVVAPLVPVPDVWCGRFVAEVHGVLAHGADVGTAVAEVRQRWLADDAALPWTTACAFAVFGSATTTLTPP